MIKEKTVFVLGAGASCPYGYPDGQKLREEICQNVVDYFTNYYSSLEESLMDSNNTYKESQLETFTQKFKNSSTKSIDLFLARNPEFLKIGKEAIIFGILKAEAKSSFREEMSNRNQDWYSYIFQKLTGELTKKEDYKLFGENQVSFITFNYDRSLEHFLYESLTNAFNGIECSKIKDEINKIKTIHIFGQVAGLDWQDMKGKIEYRRNINKILVFRLLDNLKIIYEQNNTQDLNDVHEIIRNAAKIFFLGFGYAKENLELLHIPEILLAQNIYGTALNCTKREIEGIKKLFKTTGILSKDDAIIENTDCLMLLREHL